MWAALKTVLNVAHLLALDPYPFAIDEVFDVYRLLAESGE